MPWDNRLAPKPQNAFVAPQAPLGMSIPQASRPGVAQVDPRLGLRQTAQNVSAGVGQTLVGQLEGLQQLIQNPKATVSQMWGAAKAIGADPMIVVQMLRDARRKAMSGPIGFGEVAGEFLPSPGRAAPGPVSRMADEPTKLELPKSAQQLKNLQDMAFDEHKKGAISWDDYTNRADKLIDARVKIELAEQRATNLGKIKPVWKSMTRIPVGTRVRASHGLKYKNATGVVTGTRVVQMNDGLYTLPVVDFGDGKPRTLTTFDIEQVFTPHSVD